MKSVNFVFLLILIITIIASCGTNASKEDLADPGGEVAILKDTTAKGAMRYVELSDPLESDLVARGSQIYDARCSACHTLTTEQLVAPGFAGITNRRAPEWIMNMILNVNIMLEVDSTAHQLMEEIEVVMPDQYLAVDDARSMLEFLRSNDLNRLGSKDQGRKSVD